MVKAQKMALVRGNVLIVGIDVAKKRHYARVYNQMKLDVVKPFHFHNTREGFYRLVSKIEEARSKEGAASVVIGVEPTGHYWKP
ncbi:MAG: transposase, partial [Clostridia bacterium]|nr:transposase [Clostridia bacterium]